MKSLKTEEELNSSSDNICFKCKKMFTISVLLQNHLLLNTCKSSAQYTCESCSYTTSRKGDYNKHLKTQKCIRNTKEYSKKQTYQCKHCLKTFRDNYVLNRHLHKKYPCVRNITTNIIQNTMNHIVTNNNNVIINAHDPSAFLKELNKVDKSIYHTVLGAYSINSPESIERLNDIAASTIYKKPKLINPEEYPSDEEEDIQNANNERLKEQNSRYLSNVFCKAFFDTDNLEYMPFLRIPNTNKFKVKYDNCLYEFDYDIIGSLVDIMEHKMEIIKKEKNISLWEIKKRINEVYSELRDHFIKKLKQYRYDNKRIR